MGLAHAAYNGAHTKYCSTALARSTLSLYGLSYLPQFAKCDDCQRAVDASHQPYCNPTHPKDDARALAAAAGGACAPLPMLLRFEAARYTRRCRLTLRWYAFKCKQTVLRLRTQRERASALRQVRVCE